MIIIAAPRSCFPPLPPKSMLGRHVDAVASFQTAAQPVPNIDFGGRGGEACTSKSCNPPECGTVRAGGPVAGLLPF